MYSGPPGNPTKNPSLNNPQAQIYVRGAISGALVYIPVVPESFSINKSSTWGESVPMGRSDPYIAYSSSTATIISLQARFYTVSNPYLDVVAPVSVLRSFLHPGQSGIPLPEIVYLSWGRSSNTFVIKNVSVTYKGPYDMPNMTPHQAEVSLEFHQVFFKPPIAPNYSNTRNASLI